MRCHTCLISIAAFVLLAAGCSRAPSDADIATRIKAAFFSDPLVKASALSVTVVRGEVTLAGTVTGLGVELQALKLAQETEGVRKLNDRISVVPPSEPLRQATASTAPRRGKSPAAAATPAEEPVAEAADMPEVDRELPPDPPAPRTFPRAAPRPAPVASPATPADAAPQDDTPAGAPVSGTAARPREPRRTFQLPVRLLATGPPPLRALFDQWNRGLLQAASRTRIEYSTSDESGRSQQVRQPAADLAAFDVPVSDQMLSQTLNLKILRFPAAVGGVVPICNIGGTIQTLNFSGEVLAAVFLGKITRWDDQALRMLNRQTSLPYAQINVIHRSDSSDETWLFTQYLLSAVSPDWKARIGASPSAAWPAGAGAAGNGGVLKLVRETADSIGYVDASFAFQNGLNSCALLNRAGRAIKATPDSLSAAAATLAAAPSPDFSASILDASGPGAYPIASLVWLAVRERLSDQDKREAMKSFLGWMLSRGQPDGVSLGWGSLPAPLVGWEESLLDRIQ